MKQDEYRKLVVSRVRHEKDEVYMYFHDVVVSLITTNKWLLERNVEPSRIVKGSQVLIKGRDGNKDHQLWRMDALEDLKLSE